MTSTSDIQTQVQQLIAEHQDVDITKVTRETHIVNDLGADSLDTVEMVMALEEKFNIEIPDSAAEKMVKVGDLIDYIEEQLKKAA